MDTDNAVALLRAELSDLLQKYADVCEENLALRSENYRLRELATGTKGVE